MRRTSGPVVLSQGSKAPENCHHRNHLLPGPKESCSGLPHQWAFVCVFCFTTPLKLYF